MPSKEKTDAKLAKAVRKLRKRLGIMEGDQLHHGIILGTGWGDTLRLEEERVIALSALPGFKSLGSLAGHARTVVCGYLAGPKKARKRIIALRGRIHLNESFSNPKAPRMVRQQVELLRALGVRSLILTAAVGSLSKDVLVGDVVAINGFVTIFAPDMPLHTGEFCSPEDSLDPAFRACAMHAARVNAGELRVQEGAHAMVRGPFFEGRRHDKKALADAGASVVGMSILPEACVASLFKGVRVLALGHVTNSAFEVHSHEINQERSKQRAIALGRYLAEVIRRDPYT